MPTRALFAGVVAVVEAREQVMFDTGYVAVFMATEIVTQAFLINIIFPYTKPALSLPKRVVNLWFDFKMKLIQAKSLAIIAYTLTIPSEVVVK